MGKGKILFYVMLVVVIVSVFSANSYAYEETTALGKLSRGVTNVVTSPVEIFRNINNETYNENAAYGMTVGLGKGLLQTVMRLGSGVVEIVTFPFNFPDEYKDPIIEPEYAWEDWY